MPFKIIVSPKAQLEIEEIHQYYLRRSERAADGLLVI